MGLDYRFQATAYGVSPRMRLDLVLANLMASGYATGVIKVLSDGTPWRPMVHIEDISRAMLAALSLAGYVIALRFGRRVDQMPAVMFGGFVAFQADTAALFGTFMGVETIIWVGVGGAIVSLALWGTVSPSRRVVTQTDQVGWASASEGRLGDAPARVVGDTCFVTVWVVFAYLIYELGVHYTGIDLAELFRVWAPLVPLMAIFVGFIPGCGPQVVVATMYLNSPLLMRPITRSRSR